MGLGKTVVALTELNRHLYEEYDIHKALVLAPIRVAEDTWIREADKWDHLQDLRVVRVLGDRKSRIKALSIPGDIYVMNHDNVVWLTEYLGNDWDFDAVVIDELSCYKNGHQTKRWKALKRVIRRARVIIGLTGTPAPNGYPDLWAEIYLLDGGKRLGRTLTEFRRRYLHPGRGKGHVVYTWCLNPGAKEQIDRQLDDLCISMSKEDWLKMPELIYNDVTVRMSAKSRKLYDEFEKERVLPLLDGKVIETVEDADTFIMGATAAVVKNKLLQMANGAVYDGSGRVFEIHTAKLDALEEIADSCPGQPLLVFYQFRFDVERIKARFPQCVVMNEEKTESVITRWNAGQIPMLLCHPASAGHGLNLQEGGHIIVWYSLTWSLEQYQQANARLYRQGQEQSVIVHRILCEGTEDQNVIQALDRKDETQRGFLDALKHIVDKWRAANDKPE